MEKAQKRLKEWSAYSGEMNRICGYLEDSLDETSATLILQEDKEPGQMWDFVLAQMLKELLPEDKRGAFAYAVEREKVYAVVQEYLCADKVDVEAAINESPFLHLATREKTSTTQIATTPPRDARPAQKPKSKPKSPPPSKKKPLPTPSARSMTSDTPNSGAPQSLFDLIGG